MRSHVGARRISCHVAERTTSRSISSSFIGDLSPKVAGVLWSAELELKLIRKAGVRVQCLGVWAHGAGIFSGDHFTP
jgi:hypothetical protein